jgi:hypothetical protein
LKRKLIEWDKIFENPISDKNHKEKNTPNIVLLAGQITGIDIFPEIKHNWSKIYE